MTIPVLITVRTSSSRLPQKCLLPFGEYNVLEHIIRRTQHYKFEPLVCTSTHPSDDIIQKIARQESVECFRGNMVNKLKRWFDCCEQFNVEKFHTVDADDPFFDGEQIEKSYALLDQGFDMVCPTKSSSTGSASVGYSLTCEIIKKAVALTEEHQDTEIMWSILDKVEGLKKTILPETDPIAPRMRLTLDYEEDYWLLQTVQRILGNFAIRKEVDQLFRHNPDLYLINWFRNEEWTAGQLAKQS